MKRNFIMGALALAAICAFTTPAMAQRGRGGYGGGGRGGYGGGGRGGYGGGYHGGYGGYHGGYGGYRGGYGSGIGFGIGLGSGIALGSTLGGYGGYRGGYGGYSYAPSYGSYSYAPSYGSYAEVPSTTYLAPSTTDVVPSGTYSDQAYPGVATAPQAYPGVAAAPADSSRESGYYAPQAPDNTARLRILVPDNAKVWVGGQETGQTGSEREFGSPPLTPDKAYTYEVKARWMENGEPVEQTRKVRVHANQTTTVDFGRMAETGR
jgi:uncharacterized protein (TIGR03000 family)